MSLLELAPFADEHLEDASRLLAARHAGHRQAEPLLSERHVAPAAALEEIERAWRADGASGTVALRDGRLVGYLLGAPRPDESWGDNVWVEAAGHAVEEAEDVRDLYASAAARWVEEGRPRHWALAPAHDAELLDAWWRLSFGQQHAHGIKEVPPHTDVELPAGWEIRGPREDEIEALIDVDLALPEHQRLSPTFASPGSWTRDDSREEWQKTFAKDEEKVLIGVRDGRPVACWAFVPAELSREHRGLLRPDHACHLGFAATLPEARGSGIGVALTQAGLVWAAEEGYPTMLTDWRVTNLLSSRFWPRRGFRTSFLRLYRSIP
jgi:ribosomal protein S18 acetylase RimI-like enzyme